MHQIQNVWLLVDKIDIKSTYNLEIVSTDVYRCVFALGQFNKKFWPNHYRPTRKKTHKTKQLIIYQHEDP